MSQHPHRIREAWCSRRRLATRSKVTVGSFLYSMFNNCCSQQPKTTDDSHGYPDFTDIGVSDNQKQVRPIRSAFPHVLSTEAIQPWTGPLPEEKSSGFIFSPAEPGRCTQLPPIPGSVDEFPTM